LHNNKDRIAFFLLLTVVLLGFSSCKSTTESRENPLYVWLTNDAKFILLPPEYIEPHMDNQQLMSVSFGNQSHQLIAWVKADENGMGMTFMNELEAMVGELPYRAGAVSFSSLVLPRSMGNEFIVTDFQLSFYNPVTLGQVLETVWDFFEDTGTHRPVFARNVYECRSSVADRQHNYAAQPHAAARMFLGDIPYSQRQKEHVCTEAAEGASGFFLPDDVADAAEDRHGMGERGGTYLLSWIVETHVEGRKESEKHGRGMGFPRERIWTLEGPSGSVFVPMIKKRASGGFSLEDPIKISGSIGNWSVQWQLNRQI